MRVEELQPMKVMESHGTKRAEHERSLERDMRGQFFLGALSAGRVVSVREEIVR